MGKLIILGNRIFTPMKTFENEEKLWVYLQTQANLKPDGDETDSGKWRFAYYSHRILKDVTDMMDNASFRNLACQSVAAQQNMIVICQGNPQTPQCFLATPDLDTARLKRDWCKAYAATHGLQIVMG